MSRKSRLPLVLLGSLALAASLGLVLWHLNRTAQPPSAQHVIVISLDTTRADHFGCYGNSWIRTPALDALAKESILFTDYMTVVSTTLASHVSLLTGKYPHTHGVPRNGFIVHHDNVLLAEILRDAGFYTAGFIGSFALDKRFNFAQGFDHFDQDFELFIEADEVDQDQRRAKAVTDAVVHYLDEVGVPARLFLFVHYFDPHRPYDPPTPYDTMYGSARGRIRLEKHPALTLGMATESHKTKLCQYAGEVSYMDEHVGRLLDELKQRGVLDNALLVVTSDHGENLGENPGVLFDHGWSVYQTNMHAVAMIRLPGGQNAAARLDPPVASIDVLPTMLRYLNLPIPQGVEGKVIDLVDLRMNAESRVRFGEATKPWNVEASVGWQNNPKPRCARRGEFKFVTTPFRGTEELYDLSSDPYEHRNLLEFSDPQAEIRAAELRQELRAWTALQNPLPSHFDDEHRDETIRRLKALGYLLEEEDDRAMDNPP